MIGTRKLTAWYWIFGFCVAFTMVRLVAPWFSEMEALKDLPENVVETIKWSTGLFFGANAIGKAAAAYGKKPESA